MNDMQEINSKMGFLNSILLLGPLALLVLLGCGVSVIFAMISSDRRSVQISRIVLECVALGFCVFLFGIHFIRSVARRRRVWALATAGIVQL